MFQGKLHLHIVFLYFSTVESKYFFGAEGYFGDKPCCEKKTKLKDYFIDIKSRFTYQYDFGDSWDHDVVLEKILPIMPNNIQVYPQCNQGKRACPPEG